MTANGSGTKPPEGQTGYLEPRTFEVTTQIKATGQGTASNFTAATVVPSTFGEQVRPKGHLKPKFETQGCRAGYQVLSPGATQLVMHAKSIREGQVSVAKATDRFQISKSYFGFQRDQFPLRQNLRRKSVAEFLGTSPGIKVRSENVNKIVRAVTGSAKPPLGYRAGVSFMGV